MAAKESSIRIDTRVENCNCCKKMLENLLATNLKMWHTKAKSDSRNYSSFEGIYDDTKLMNALFDCYGQLKYCRECVILYFNISPNTLKKMKDHVKNNPCPYRFRIKNKIRSAHYKLPAKRDFFNYIIKNRRPNTQYDKAGAPMYFLDNRFECIRLPSASDRQFIKKAEKSLVWHFNIEQLRHNRQTISSRTAHNWIKSEFPYTTLSPTQSWLCCDCKKLRKKEIARVKNNKKNDSPDSGITMEMQPAIDDHEQKCTIDQQDLTDKQDDHIQHFVSAEGNDEHLPQQPPYDPNRYPLITQHRLASNQAMDAYNSVCVQCQLNWAGIQQIATETTDGLNNNLKFGQIKDQYKATLDCDFQSTKTLPQYGFSQHEDTKKLTATERYTLFNIKEHGLDDKHIYICRDDSDIPVHRCDYIVSFLDDYIKYYLPTWVKNLVVITNRDNRSKTFINWFINLIKFGHFRFIQLMFTHPGHGGIATELISMQFAHKFYGRDICDLGDLAQLAKEFATAHILDNHGVYAWQQLLPNCRDGIYSDLNYHDDVYNIYWKGEQTQVNHFSFTNINDVQVDYYQHVPPVQHTTATSYAYLKRNMSLPLKNGSGNSKKRKTSCHSGENGNRRSHYLQI